MEEILDMAVLLSDDDEDMDDLVIDHLLDDGAVLGPRAELYGRFNFDNMLDIECVNLFRFTKEDIVRLARGLGIPESITTTDRVTISGRDALCVLLRRLAYPNRLVDLEPFFGYCSAVLSNIFNTTLNIIADRKCHLLENLANNHYLDFNRLQQYAQAVLEKGSPIRNCWGFIDGTARPICRPTVEQENYYSGHKKYHCLKFQSVMCPDGIIVSLKGPYEGRSHDAGILRQSGLYEELEENMVFPGQDPPNFVLYGDTAYGLRELLLKPYSEYEIGMNPERQNFNTLMSVLRVSVEWGFSNIIQQFAYVDFKKNQNSASRCRHNL